MNNLSNAILLVCKKLIKYSLKPGLLKCSDHAMFLLLQSTDSTWLCTLLQVRYMRVCLTSMGRSVALFGGHSNIYVF